MKTILITGANRGIGLELTRQYSEAGWQVLACCRSPDKASELQNMDSKQNIDILSLDLHKHDSIQELASQLKNTAIDIMINNAGIVGNQLTFGDIDHETFSEALKVNTIAPVLVAQSLINQITKGHKKIIVNISSYLASIELNTEDDWAFPIYRISKSALNSATKCMANNLKEKNITVISMDPGWVKTDMGGEDADLTPAESVSGIKKVLEEINLSHTGEFFRYDGSKLPW
jgi:NAD(P)-dependent dehydrogenase (short-subunit alcohol dehydrogenase family)